MVMPTHSPLTPQEQERYARHLCLPQVGEDGQLRLKAAKVLIIGLGGLGSPAALYLSAAGIGVLGLVDFDKVEHSNLQRQILYGDKDIGKSKTEQGRKLLTAQNPALKVETYEQALDKELAHRIFPQFDLIIDGTDNYETRYLINDMCLLHQRPNLSASIHQFEGRISLFCHAEGPCYRCLFPAPPPPGQTANCSEAGVFGVLPGVLGLLQATEAIKFFLGLGETLIGRYLIYDALAMAFKEIKLQANPACASCSQPLTYDAIIASPWSCAQDRISVEEFAELKQQREPMTIIDVRNAEEVRQSCIAGALWVPLGELAQKLSEFSRGQSYIIYCQKGQRSQQAVQLLKNENFTDVKSLHGGIEKWHAYINGK